MNVQIGVIGAGRADEELKNLAREVGRLSARKGWTVFCGGLGGVMEAAAEGAAREGGLVIGLLPGASALEGNPFLSAAVPTDMGHARNVLIARSADVLIAVGGGYGTLSEMALGLKMGKPVISLRSWTPEESVVNARTAADAVSAAEAALGDASSGNRKEI